MDTWVNLERFIAEYQHRPLSERLRDRQRLLVQRLAYSSTARKLFGKQQPTTSTSPRLVQFEKTHAALVDELQALIGHARTTAATFAQMGHLWSALVEADACALVEQAHVKFLAAGTKLATLCMTCGTEILAMVVQPLEAKCEKLKQLHGLLRIEHDMQLLVLAATRKLERAHATGSKNVFHRQNELTAAKGYATRVATDLHVILDWVDTMRRQLVRLEMNSLASLLARHAMTAADTLLSPVDQTVVTSSSNRSVD
ncbi:hypothetical protein AaE_013780 [Aphanomyces astaci]|uniref:Uncharacterized protein n=1 Tax=Aphanomyces astaci TaxID=112090 RepID=A0A6A4Z9N1_APHAT|nr:hypothetical protein AaE_013780 [Aphanomyces astaci]